MRELLIFWLLIVPLSFVDAADLNINFVLYRTDDIEETAVVYGYDPGNTNSTLTILAELPVDKYPVTVIESKAFNGCPADTIIIPSSVTTIAGCAFKRSSVKNISIGGEGTYLGHGVFRYCKQLTNITFNATVYSIKKSIFADNPLLTSVVFYSTPPALVGDVKTPDTRATSVFYESTNAIVYRLPNSHGWPAVPGEWMFRPTAYIGSPPTPAERFQRMIHIGRRQHGYIIN